MLISIYNNYSRYNYTYLEAGLIKIIEIIIYYTILCLYILYKSELYTN